MVEPLWVSGKYTLAVAVTDARTSKVRKRGMCSKAAHGRRHPNNRTPVPMTAAT